VPGGLSFLSTARIFVEYLVVATSAIREEAAEQREKSRTVVIEYKRVSTEAVVWSSVQMEAATEGRGIHTHALWSPPAGRQNARSEVSVIL